MKIVSINSKYTKSTHEVAFNVDTPPAAGVMEKISYGQLSIRFEDGLLYARSSNDHPEISKIVVDNLAAKIATAEQLVLDEAAESSRKHLAMVEAVSKSTGLSIQ